MLIEPVDDEQLAPEVKAIFDAVRDQYGLVPNILRTMAHNPELLTAFVPLWAEVYRSPAIGARLRALAALGTAKAQQCTYCMAHMTASARQAGLSEEEIGAIGVDSAAFAAREALVLEVAEELTRDPDGVTDDLRARLRASFDDSEIVNIILAVGMYNLTSRFLKALSIEVEDVLVKGAR
jgi:uncharacterized peroxidase-related enzyme